MEHLLNEIEKAIDCGLYHVALISSLALPDICAALESENGKTSPDKYKRWYTSYALGRASNRLNSEDCYLLRCSMIHQAKTVPSPRGKQNANYSRVIFLLPNPHLVAHDNIFDDVLNLDLKEFCSGMIEAVRVWLAKMVMEQNKSFYKNHLSLVGRYSDGLSPFITGIPNEILT